MTVTLTCSECGSAVSVYPSEGAKAASCDVCSHQIPLNFEEEHMGGVLKKCPCCGRRDFYQQKDFNRKIGVALFVVAALVSPWTYGLSLVALWLADLFLFRRLGSVAVCYKCRAIFRRIQNMGEMRPFDHEMHDRVVYADHDFKGRPLESHQGAPQ